MRIIRANFHQHTQPLPATHFPRLDRSAKNKWSASQIDIFLILYGEVQFKLLSRRPAGSNDPYYCPSHLSGDQRVEIQCRRPPIGQTATNKVTQGDTAFSANPLFIHNPGECECRLSRDTSHPSPSGPTSYIQLQYLFIALHFRAGPHSAYFCPLIACKMWFLQAPDTLWAAGRLCSVVWGGRRLAKSGDASIENHAFLFSQLSRVHPI